MKVELINDLSVHAALAGGLSSNNQLEIEVSQPSDTSSDTPHRSHATEFQLNEQPLKPVWKLADDSRLGMNV